MKPPPCSVALGAALLLASPLVAQRGSASVEGVVSAQDDGSTLSGSTVEVVGASHIVLTDESGRYTLRGISSGTISLRYMTTGVHDPHEDRHAGQK